MFLRRQETNEGIYQIAVAAANRNITTATNAFI
jgi:hypothetical protein